jgi:hypothetical protein
LCDRLIGSEYSIQKTEQIQNDAEIDIKKVDSAVTAKLKELKKEKEKEKDRVALSFSWLAIIMICLLFIIVLLSDLFKLVSYLKESHREVDKSRIIPIQMNKNERERMCFQTSFGKR